MARKTKLIEGALSECNHKGCDLRWPTSSEPAEYQQKAVKVVVEQPGSKPTVTWWMGTGYIRLRGGGHVKIVCPGSPGFRPGKLSLSQEPGRKSI